MLFKVFIAQWERPVKNDWTEQVKDNLISLGFETDLEWVRKFKKDKFKKMVKSRIQEVAFQDLLASKEKHSKLKNLQYTGLKMQEYLSHSDISVNQARILFKSRTRMTNYWNNFRGLVSCQFCPVCKNENIIDSQEHSLECEVMVKNLKIDKIQ